MLTDEDLEPQRDRLSDPKKNLKSGFKWLGIASIVSQALDAVSLFVIMFFITDKQMGIATLAVSFATCITVFESLGVGTAIIQATKLKVNELHSLFWFSVIVGVAICVVMMLVSIPVSWFYGSEGLLPLMLFACLKIVVTSPGSVVNGLITRRLEYYKSTITNVVSTLFSSMIKIVFAALSFGAWSLVVATVVYSLMYLIMVFILSRYLPAFHFKFSECKRFLQFGFKHCVSMLGEQLNKNLHYFIVGGYFGDGVLGVYRVGFELAMTPALALLNVVNRSSFPVFAKIKDKREELSSIFSWNQGNIGIFSAVPVVFLLFCSEDVFMLIKDGKWSGAVHFMPLALAVAYVKSLIQTFPDLFRACGKPHYSIRAAVFESILCAGFLCAALALCYVLGITVDASLNVLFMAWLLLFIPLFFYDKKMASEFINISLFSTIKSIWTSLLFVIVTAVLSVIPWYYKSQLIWQPWLHMGIEVMIILECILLFATWNKKRKYSHVTGTDSPHS